MTRGRGIAIAKQKYYVVWKGRRPGIYETWAECKEQTAGYSGAKFKSFPTFAEAEDAFGSDATKYITSKSETPVNKQGEVNSRKEQNNIQKTIISESISVDAACSGNPGPMEYRGVHTETGEEIFHVGPVANGTNNIGEFLAIVHALALLKKKNSNLPIYSDSDIAIGWVKKKGLNTSIPRDESTKEVWNLIDRATKWLEQNDYSNDIYKWDTATWGEIKADFGRK